MKAILALSLALFVGGGADDAVKKDLKAFAGSWKLDSVENNQGRDPNAEGGTVKFDGDKMEYTKDGDVKKGKIKLNPAGKPREIDITPEGKDEILTGIYQIDGKSIKLCLMMDPKGARPTAFEAKESQLVIVLKKTE